MGYIDYHSRPLSAYLWESFTEIILIPPEGVCAFCDFLIASTTPGVRQVKMHSHPNRGRAAPVRAALPSIHSAATEGVELDQCS